MTVPSTADLHLAADPALSARAAHRLAAQGGMVAQYLAANPSCPDDVLALLTQDADPQVRRTALVKALARGLDPARATALLAAAAVDPATQVKLVAARDARTPLVLLRDLALDDDAILAAAANRTLPADQRRYKVTPRPEPTSRTRTA